MKIDDNNFSQIDLVAITDIGIIVFAVKDGSMKEEININGHKY